MRLPDKREFHWILFIIVFVSGLFSLSTIKEYTGINEETVFIWIMFPILVIGVIIEIMILAHQHRLEEEKRKTEQDDSTRV